MGDDVEVLARRQVADEELPGLRGIRPGVLDLVIAAAPSRAALALQADGKVGLQVSRVRSAEDQVLGDGPFGGAGVSSRRETPTKDLGGERLEVDPTGSRP